MPGALFSQCMQPGFNVLAIDAFIQIQPWMQALMIGYEIRVVIGPRRERRHNQKRVEPQRRTFTQQPRPAIRRDGPCKHVMNARAAPRRSIRLRTA